MQDNIIQKYLESKGLEFTLVNGQFRLKKSPITGEEKGHHFYISATDGMWDDKKAQRSGNWSQFMTLYGDDVVELPHIQYVQQEVREYTRPKQDILQLAQRLQAGEDQYLLDYLIKERGLTEKTLTHFRIGLENKWITIPIINKKGEVVNIRKRKDPRNTDDSIPRYLPEKGCKAILFNEKCLLGDPLELYLTEGEFDAMVLHQNGFTNVVSTTLGAGYFPNEWAEQLKGVKRIYACYDNDSAGQEGVKKVSELLGKDRVRIVKIPKSEKGEKVDISDFFGKEGKTRADFVELVNNAVNIDGEITKVRHISEYSDDLKKRLLEGDYKGVLTGYDKFDTVIGGLRKGRVIVWSGLPSVGKTSASINVALSLAYRNIPSIYITTEMGPLDIYRKFVLLQQKLPGNAVDKVVEGSAVMQSIERGIAKFSNTDGSPGLPIYTMDSVGVIDIKNVISTCKDAVENFGTQVIFIDHLHYFSLSLKNQEAEISSIMKKIKALALELNTPIVLLAHIGREGRSKQRRGLYIPTMQDLKGSSAIEQDADQIVFVCRDSEAVDENEKRKTVWKVAKNRDGATGYVSLDFNQNIGYFSEVNGVDYMPDLDTITEGFNKGKKGGRDNPSREDIDNINSVYFG